MHSDLPYLPHGPLPFDLCAGSAPFGHGVLSVYILADEKHSHCLKEKVYLPTIVRSRVIWHLGYTEHANAAAFTNDELGNGMPSVYTILTSTTLESNISLVKSITCETKLPCFR